MRNFDNIFLKIFKQRFSTKKNILFYLADFQNLLSNNIFFLRGVDVLRGLDSNDDRTASETKKCLQRSGVASFHLGKYKEAKNSFSEAVKFDSTGIK